MRSNYSPYQQQDRTKMQERLQEIEIAKRQVLLANEHLATVLRTQIPLLLRHHTAERPIVKLSLDQMKRELQASNSSRVTAADEAWAFAMADIETIRAEYHAKQEEERQRERVKKAERATLSYDSDLQQYYIMRAENSVQSDGTVRPTQRKVYLPADHEYLR